MVDEITKGLKPGGMFRKVKGGANALKEQFKGKKITIAMMPHESLDEDDGLFNKNLVYTIRLKDTNEALAGFSEEDGYIDIEYMNSAKEELIKRENKADKKRLKTFQVFEKRRKNREINADIADLAADEIRYAIENAPVHIDAFVVRENERALFMKAGQSMGVVEPGMWACDSDFSQSGTEIIFVDISQFKYNWGFSEILTGENARIGSHGTTTFQIKNINNFIINLVSSKTKVDQSHVEAYINDKLKSVIKNVVGSYNIPKLVKEDDKVISARVRSKMHESLEGWGLDVVDVTILGFKLPDEFEKLFKEHANASIDSARVSIDSTMADNTISRIGIDGKVKSASLNQDASLDIQKTQLEFQKEQQRIELEKMKQQMALQQQQHEAELARIKRKINAEDNIADIDVNEIKGLSEAKVYGAKSAVDNNHEVSKIQMENQRQTDIERIKIGQSDRELRHEEKISEMKYDRDAKVAGSTGYSAGLYSGSGVGVGGPVRLVELEKRKIELQEKLDKLDDLLMEEQIKKEMYERRSNLIMNELEDIRRETMSLKKM